MKRQFKLFFIILITAVAASALTLFITGNTTIFGQGSAALTNSKFEKFNKAYEQIKSDYYQKTDDSKLVDGAIKGMISSLDDPYSSYMGRRKESLLKKPFPLRLKASAHKWKKRTAAS